MKEFSQAEIEGAEAYFTSQKYRVEEVRVGDLEISYFVLPQSSAPDLPDFAWRMTHTDPQTGKVSGRYGVSDSVPEELRPYWVAHEKIEFEDIGINTSGRCISAERRIIDLVPGSLKSKYVIRRTAFFTNLVEYFRKDLKAGTGNYTKADFREAVSVRQYLRGLQIQKHGH